MRPAYNQVNSVFLEAEMRMRQFAIVLLLLVGLFTQPASAQVYRNLESVDPLSGWACNKATPGASIRIEIYMYDNVQSYPPIVVQTNAVRSDISAFCGTAGRYVFSATVPQSVKNDSAGRAVTTDAYAVVDGNYYQMPSKQKVYVPSSAMGPRVTATFRTSSRQKPSDDSTTLLFKLGENKRWDWVASSEGTTAATANGRILDGAMSYWFHYSFPTPVPAPPSPVPMGFTDGTSMQKGGFECGYYMLAATEENGETAFKEFPMCNNDVDLGTITLDPYPVKFTISQPVIKGGKVVCAGVAENSETDVEFYGFVSSPGTNTFWVPFATDKQDLLSGTSPVNCGFAVPDNVLRGISDMSVEIIAVKKGAPYRPIGRKSFTIPLDR